ncbi:hypothetical protein AtNW77_Chr2g0251711 [Arabidopsis thaliana]
MPLLLMLLLKPKHMLTTRGHSGTRSGSVLFPGYRVYSGRRLRTIRVFLKFGSVSVRVRVDSVRVRFGFFRVVKWRTHSDNSKSRVRVRFGYFSGFSVRVFGSGYYAQAYLKHICTSLWRTF